MFYRNSNRFSFHTISVMDHKYKALLQNIPTKHIMAEFASAEQIITLRKLDITNFFVLGSLKSITNVLGKLIFVQINSSDRQLKSN